MLNLITGAVINNYQVGIDEQEEEKKEGKKEKDVGRKNERKRKLNQNTTYTKNQRLM